MKESRVRFLEQSLSILGYDKALRALDWVMQEMCAEKGFTRHNGTHYYYHLVDTTQDLLNHGIKDEDILTACLLHDIVEDVDGITLVMVEDKFGSNVAIMVGLVTKKDSIDYKVYEDTRNYLNIILANIGACLIKTADCKHNFGTLLDATPAKKLRKALEVESLHIPFIKECRNRYPRYANYFFSAKTTIEPHLWEIKAHYEEIVELKVKYESEVAKCK